MTNAPAIALVTGGTSGIGKAIAQRLAMLPYIEKVLLVSRQRSTIKYGDFESAKFVFIAADIATQEGREKIVEGVRLHSDAQSPNQKRRQLRYLIHSAAIIEPIAPIHEITPEELRYAMAVNVEGPFFLSTALYPFMEGCDNVAGRILHVSSGVAHVSPFVGWGAYCISKTAFHASFKVLSKEFQHLGGKVVVGSFVPGVVDTPMQTTIRKTPEQTMPEVSDFISLKEQAEKQPGHTSETPKPPSKDALDSPCNVAAFAQWLLLDTTDQDFSARDYDISDRSLFERWIPVEQ